MDFFDWVNIYGFIFMVIIMIPNIVFAAKCKDGFENLWHHKKVELFEQIGRFGSFGFMVLTIPYTYFGFANDICFWVYIIVNGIVVSTYCIIWIVCFRHNSIFRALALSILPSIVFIFSGIMVRSICLIIFSLIFAPMHILLSYKNASLAMKSFVKE